MQSESKGFREGPKGAKGKGQLPWWSSPWSMRNEGRGAMCVVPDSVCTLVMWFPELSAVIYTCFTGVGYDELKENCSDDFSSVHTEHAGEVCFQSASAAPHRCRLL